MARALRFDRAGALYHVTNRGHGHRLLFNGAADARVFLGLLERACKERGLEVHSFCVLGTHFHLVVSTKGGGLAGAIGWVEDLYARYFNRTRDRDGHVVKARYTARLIDDPVYLVVVLAYVDRNPVVAGIVRDAGTYPYSSAHAYLGGGTYPWLRRDVVERVVCRLSGRPTYSPELYPSLWSACSSAAGDTLVAEATRRPNARVAPIAELLRAGPMHVQRWLAEMAVNEEGPRGLALTLSPEAVLSLVPPGDAVARDSRGISKRQLTAGLLYLLAGLTRDAIAIRTGVSPAQVSEDISAYRRAVTTGALYASSIARQIEAALRRDYGRALAAMDCLSQK